MTGVVALLDGDDLDVLGERNLKGDFKIDGVMSVERPALLVGVVMVVYVDVEEVEVGKAAT